MTATPIAALAPSADDERWAQIIARAPKMAATMRSYLDQISVSLRPRSVDAADNALRCLAIYLTTETRVRSVKGLRREHIEGFKVWLAQRPAGRDKTLSARTIRHRLGILRVFLERLIDWDWADAPRSCPILQTDLPRVDDPLPRFLDDTEAAALMRTAAAAEPFDRLIMEMLARTGLRVGEFCTLEAGAVVRIGASHWLKVPVGKLRNDRYLPLHPVLVELLDAWRADHPDDTWLIARPDGRSLTRDAVGRIVKRIGKEAGIATTVTPHRLRHTLATQAVNRGMSLEAIAALLGHRSLRMTLVYARIADRKVADEYFTVTEQVEALYTADQPALPATAEGQAMRRLRLEMQRRDLGNGYCNRPLDQAKAELGGIEIEQVVVAFRPPTRCEVSAETAHSSLLGVWPDGGPHRDPSTPFLVEVCLWAAPVGVEEAVCAVPPDGHRLHAASIAPARHPPALNQWAYDHPSFPDLRPLGDVVDDRTLQARFMQGTGESAGTTAGAAMTRETPPRWQRVCPL